MPGEIGLFEAETIGVGTGGEFAFAEQIDDGDPGGMSQGLEEFRFELAEGAVS